MRLCSASAHLHIWKEAVLLQSIRLTMGLVAQCDAVNGNLGSETWKERCSFPVYTIAMSATAGIFCITFVNISQQCLPSATLLLIVCLLWLLRESKNLI